LHSCGVTAFGENFTTGAGLRRFSRHVVEHGANALWRSSMTNVFVTDGNDTSPAKSPSAAL
jgi:hypothetical protein